jgi:hypothetical protein
MDNCGMPELHTLNERQLRLKRVCADHFASMSFICPVTRNQLTEKAVPLNQKEHEAAVKAAQELAMNPKRGRGRPPKAFSLLSVKKEPVEAVEVENDNDEEEYEEEDEEVEDDEEEYPNENGDVEYNPPPTLKRQARESGGEPKGKNPKAKPPKLTAVGDTAEAKAAAKAERKLHKQMLAEANKPKFVSALLPAPIKHRDGRTSNDKRQSGGRRMADLSVIEDVVKEMSMGVVHKIKKKRRRMNSDEKILSKRMKMKASSSFNNDIDLISDEDITDIDDSEDEEAEGLARANREFEMFQIGLRKFINLPPTWGMGSVVWDPLNKIKVIPITEPKLQPNGTICLFKAIQVKI